MYRMYINDVRNESMCVCISLFVHLSFQPTFRYEESCVEEMRESVVVAFSFPFLVALLTDNESCEGAIYRVIGYLPWREDRGRYQETVVGTLA